MVSPESAVYCTLILSDNYLPGAMILAHSLRDNGTNFKLAALYTPDRLQTATINELQTVYDVLIPVHAMTNQSPANLWLMERPDLIATFTKIELWRQTQFKRIVYIDCDVVALRAPDELFDLDVDFAAAPDVGWPDCFNSGVMVLRPNLEDYFALKALAERSVSFDGADQGLLNMHFRDWHRISFTYNCTPSANYQYIPAYKHFQNSISMIHFIGSQKPWNMPRQVSPVDSPYNQLLGRWWAVYDRHYRPEIAPSIPQPTSRPSTPHEYHRTQNTVTETPHVECSQVPAIQEPLEKPPFTQLKESKPDLTLRQHELRTVPHPVPQPIHHAQETFPFETQQLPHSYDPTNAPSYAGPIEPTAPVAPLEPHSIEHQFNIATPAPVLSVVPQWVRGEEHVKTYIRSPSNPLQAYPTEHAPWTQEPPPLDQGPVTHHVYQHRPHQEPMNENTEIIKRSPTLPQQTPEPEPEPEPEPTFEPPKAEWDASREPPPLNSRPEGIALEKKTYKMSEDSQLFQPPPFYPEAPKNMYYEVPSTKPEPQKIAQVFPWETHAPRPTRVFLDDDQPPVSPIHHRSSSESTKEEPMTSVPSMTTSWTSEDFSTPWMPSESFDTYSRSNAWDEVPEIQQYIQSIQQARRGRVQVISGGPPGSQNSSRWQQQQHPIFPPKTSVRITDFPSEFERPSLPVTPTPIRRPPAIMKPGEQYGTEELPAAEGVPNQEDWNPSARLEELQRRQSEILDNPDLIFERFTKALSSSGRLGDMEGETN